MWSFVHGAGSKSVVNMWQLSQQSAQRPTVHQHKFPNQRDGENVPDTSRPFTLRLNCFATVPCPAAALTDELTSIRHVTMPRKNAVDDERRKLIEDMMMIPET